MICIYSQDNTEYTKNGDAVLIPTVCNLQMTINGSWALTLEHPYDTEDRYKYIVEGAVIRADIKCIRELTVTQQRFRIYQYTKNLHSVSAIAFPIAMESTYDSPIDNIVLQNKTGVEAMAALQAYSNKYTLYTDITARKSASFANTNINNAIASDDGFISIWGGEIVYDNLKYSVRSKLGDSNANFAVHYGRNLSEIDYQIDDSGLTTRIRPISKDGIRLNGSGQVDSPKIDDYPIIHTRYMTAPYELIEDDDASPSATAVATRTARSAVSSAVTNASEDSYDDALDAGYQPEYIKSLKADIITAVTAMALTSVTSASLYNYLSKVISDAMNWLGNLTQPEWGWRGSSETGWWYGNDDSYAKSMYVKIGKKWSYFGANGYWQEPADDSDEWDWYQVTGEEGRRYGNFTKYYAHNTFVYITREGVLKKYWFDKEGYFDEEKSGDSDWQWNGTGTSEDPYWFGNPDAEGDEKKYAHDTWLFIDGVYYFFDSHGYYDGSTKFDDYQWDWVESGENIWFGNPEDSEFAAVYVTNQWLKINGSWYYFDANGYVVSDNTSKNNAIAVFTTGMASVKNTVDAQNTTLYSVLYELMRDYANKQYADGADNPALTVTVNMVDLSKTTEYAGYAALEEVKLGDSVVCVDDEHDISITSRVVGLTYDCIRDYNMQVVIGSPAATMSEILGTAGGTPVAGGFDTSAIEAQIHANTEAIGTNAEDIQDLKDSKQNKLIAGNNITLTNVGSQTRVDAEAGGGGLEYFVETQESLYGEQTLSTPKWSCLEDYYFDYEVADHVGISDPSEHSPIVKSNSTPAIVCAIITNSSGHFSNYLVGGIAFISKSAEGTAYQFTRNNVTYSGGYSVGDTRLDGSTANMVETYTYDGETWYVAVFGSLGLSGGGYPQDGNILHPTGIGGDFKNIHTVVGEIFNLVDPYKITKIYSGLHQGTNLAFFAGGTDSNGANAPIKIFNDGTSEGLGAVDDVKVDGVSVVADKIANIDLSTYAKKSEIPEIEANPSDSATDALTKIDIDGTVYEIQGGGSGGSALIMNAQKYSTEEQVVGIWTDGKPLYQKTLSITVNRTDYTVDLSSLSIDKIVSGYGYIGHSNGVWKLHFPYYDSANYYSVWEYEESTKYFHVVCTSQMIQFYPYVTVTIQYTKTTDSAGSGGYQAYGFSPIIYSEEEREVGVWVDNKPLYSKAYPITEMTIRPTGTLISEIDISAMEMLVNGYGVSRTYGQVTPLSLYDYNGLNGASNIAIAVDLIVIYYTKTTDVAGSGEYNTLGIPNVHYDNSEKVIGTYFGETLYEMTVNIGSNSNANFAYIIGNNSDYKFKKLVSLEGSCAYIDNGEIQAISIPAFMAQTYYCRIYAMSDIGHFVGDSQYNGKFGLYFERSNDFLKYYNNDICVTIRYTKTAS